MSFEERKITFGFDASSGTLAPHERTQKQQSEALGTPLEQSERSVRQAIKQLLALEYHIDFFPGMAFAPEIKQLLFTKFSGDDAMPFLIQQMFTFLEADTVEDYLDTDDDTRKIREDQVIEKHGQTGKAILENNKLRPNRLADTYQPMAMIVDIVSALSPESESELRLAFSLLDSRPTDWTDREFMSSDGKFTNRPFPIYKMLSRAEKQVVVDSYTFATFRMIEILLAVNITAPSNTNVTW